MLPIKEQIIRIFFSLIVGTIIGLERKYRGKPAGVRTHAIICIICTMLTMLSAYGFYQFPTKGDPSRLIANILTGVGFLAGGVIYSVNRGDKKTVHGLTTAAGIWGAACLGIPIGLGLYPITFITLVAIEFVLFVEGILIHHKKSGDGYDDDDTEEIEE